MSDRDAPVWLISRIVSEKQARDAARTSVRRRRRRSESLLTLMLGTLSAALGVVALAMTIEGIAGHPRGR